MEVEYRELARSRVRLNNVVSDSNAVELEQLPPVPAFSRELRTADW